MQALQDRLKDELSPSYVLEVPDMPGLCVEDIKKIYRLRTQLVRRRRGGGSAEDETLWAALGEAFAPALKSNITVGG
jgi:hypothetical protein